MLFEDECKVYRVYTCVKREGREREGKGGGWEKSIIGKGKDEKVLEGRKGDRT